MDGCKNLMPLALVRSLEFLEESFSVKVVYLFQHWIGIHGGFSKKLCSKENDLLH